MPSRRVTAKTAESRASADRRAHGVVLEELRSQMALVLEAVTSSRTELKAEIAELRTSLTDRITALEQAVRQNSADIRQNSEDIRKNSEDIQELREEMSALRHDFDHRAELGRLASLEERVAAIETRLGRTA